MIVLATFYVFTFQLCPQGRVGVEFLNFQREAPKTVSTGAASEKFGQIFKQYQLKNKIKVGYLGDQKSFLDSSPNPYYDIFDDFIRIERF